VLVFTSGDPDYVTSHVDLTRVQEYRQEAAKLTGVASIALLFRHLSASRLVSIAQIEGRVRSGGSEFVLARDMRFADTDVAEHYGWIDRARPARALGEFVRALAGRIAGFPAAGLLVIEERVNAVALAPTDDLRRDSDLFGEQVGAPESIGRWSLRMTGGAGSRPTHDASCPPCAAPLAAHWPGDGCSISAAMAATGRS
jgi:enoyl-CoA hydratase/carnithine racemase